MAITEDGAETLKREEITEVLKEMHIHAVNVPSLRVTGRKERYLFSPQEYVSDTVDISFYDDPQTIVHLEAVSQPHEMSGYPGGFKRDLLYSRIGDGKRIITASGFHFEGPVKVVSEIGESLDPRVAEIIRSVDFFHVRGNDDESGLDDAYERHIMRSEGLVIVPVSLNEAKEVYYAIVDSVPNYLF